MDNNYINKDHVRTIRKILSSLEQSIQLLHSEDSVNAFAPLAIEIPNDQFDNTDVSSVDGQLLTEQLDFLSKIAQDLHKRVQDLHAKSTAMSENELPKALS
jgi:hypothetical protein